MIRIKHNRKPAPGSPALIADCIALGATCIPPIKR